MEESGAGCADRCGCNTRGYDPESSTGGEPVPGQVVSPLAGCEPPFTLDSPGRCVSRDPVSQS